MKKVLNKKLDEKAMLAGIFAFAALGFLYLYVAATVNNTEAPIKETLSITQNTTITQESQPTENEMKKYRSDFMKIEFDYPENYVVDEKVNIISLQSENSVLEIEKQAVNYENLEEYYGFFASKRNNIIEKRDVVIGGKKYITIKLLIDSNNFEQMIMTVVDYTRYTFSTKNQSLFLDLEKIAKSFKILE